MGNCRTRRPPISFFFLCGRRGLYYLSDVFCSFFFFFFFHRQTFITLLPVRAGSQHSVPDVSPTFPLPTVAVRLSLPEVIFSPHLTWPQPCLPPSPSTPPPPQLFPFCGLAYVIELSFTLCCSPKGVQCKKTGTSDHDGAVWRLSDCSLVG